MKPKKSMLVVAINLIVLIAYTVFFRIMGTDLGSAFGVALFIILQLIICVILGLAIESYRNSFFLAALMVLLIGFSTCYLAFNIQ